MTKWFLKSRPIVSKTQKLHTPTTGAIINDIPRTQINLDASDHKLKQNINVILEKFRH